MGILDMLADKINLPFFKKNPKIILTILSLSLSIIIFRFLFIFQPLKVIRTYPKNLENQVSPDIKISFIFNKKIPLQNWEIKTIPEFEYQISISKEKLEIIPDSLLKYQTTYQIYLSNPQFPKFSYSLLFTTATTSQFIPSLFPTTSSSTEEGKGDPNFYLEILRREKIYFPLGKYLPYETPNWKIKGYYDKLKITVILKKDTPENRQEVLDWIKSKGVEPSTHYINWITSP